MILPGTVHLWHATLDVDARVLAPLEAVLSPDELARANRFVFREHRNRFIVARSLLRFVLAGYRGEAPERLAFAYGEHGKPRLVREGGPAFNLSHSGDRGLLGVALDDAVGVDVEAVREDWSPDDVMARFFSPAECRALRALAVEDRQRAFFRVWTRKEAYIKAHGRGLSMGLDSFDVSVREGEGNCLLATRPRAEDVTAWWIRGVDAPAGFEAALATAGSRSPDVQAFTWDPASAL